MNFDPHRSSGGDGRRPHRHPYNLGRHKEAPRKSRKGQQRQSRTALPPAATAGSAGDVTDDDAFFCATLVAAMNAAEDTIARMAQQNAQAVANPSLAAQAPAAQAMPTQAMATQTRVARGSAARSDSQRTASPTPLPPSGAHPSASFSAGASSSMLEPRVRCPHCIGTYVGYDNLRRHVQRIHDNGSSRHCHRCRFVSANSETFSAHMSAHKRFSVCRHCGVRNNFSAHAQHVHNCPTARSGAGPRVSAAHATSPTPLPLSGAHPLASSSAGASSSRSESLNRCPHCDRVYSFGAGLRNHVKRANERGSSRYCVRCRFVSDDSEAFRAHMRTHDRRIQCHRCRRKFSASEYTAHRNNCQG